MINLQNTYEIIRWYKEYQPWMKNEDWKALYLKLIEEEMNEVEEALKNRNLEEYLDGIGDVYWVATIYFYLAGEIDNDTYALLFSFFWATNLKPRKWKEVMDAIMKEIVKSNFTKSLELQSDWEKAGKVVKGEKFKAPCFKRIIKKWNLDWATKEDNKKEKTSK
mgnify:CR=1 FL=1